MTILLCSLSVADSLRKLLKIHLQNHQINTIEISGVDPSDLARKLSEELGKTAKKAVFLGANGLDVYARAAAYQNLAPVICHDPLKADSLRQSGCFHTLCMGSNIIKPKYAFSILDVWLMNDMMAEDNQ